MYYLVEINLYSRWLDTKTFQWLDTKTFQRLVRVKHNSQEYIYKVVSEYLDKEYIKKYPTSEYKYDICILETISDEN